MKKQTVSAFAPATIGNVCVGFDILGLAVNILGDTVTLRKIDKSGHIEIKKITGCQGLPLDPHKNTATVGLLQLIEDLHLDFGFEVTIKKEIPMGSGMGGSAASAVAAIVAANALLKKSLNKNNLMKYALMGEAVASGGMHGDNIAPCLYGGLTLVRGIDPVDIVAIPTPSKLLCVLVHPHIRLDTKDARQILKPSVSLKEFVHQSANLAGFIAGCFKGDVALLQRSFDDIIIEHQRRHLIMGFNEVKTAALENGALGCTISGAGPSVFALAVEMKSAKAIKNAMVAAFKDAGASPVQAWISPINKNGAYLL